MRLYFQAGKNRRLAIDTERRIWNNDYYYLGPCQHYIAVSVADYNELLKEIDFNCFDYAKNFREGV